MLACLVFIAVGGTKIWSVLSTARIRCDGTFDDMRAFPGESLTLATSVENGKWLPVSIQIFWTFENGLKPAGKNSSILHQEASVLWHQTLRFEERFVALRRGVYQVGPPRIYTGDLLGFFKKKINAIEPGHMIIYPRLVPLKPIAIKQRDLFGTPGAKSPVHDPIYILGTRDYQISRPSRHIHWKASARHLRLQEKVFEPSGQQKVLLTLDVEAFNERRRLTSFEHTIEVLASLAVKLDRRGYAIGLAVNGSLKGGNASVVPVNRGPLQITAILETLARLQATPNQSIGDLIQRTVGSRWGVSCVHFCYGGGTYLSDMAKFFRKRKIPGTFLTCRPGTESPLTRKSHGFLRYTIDDIRLDGSVNHEPE